MNPEKTEHIIEIIKYIAEIIKAASESTLGVISLMWISICLIAFLFFHDAPIKTKLIIFFCLFVGTSGFSWATISNYPPPPPPDCSLHIESAKYTESENKLIVRITGDATNVEDYSEWELISTSNACNDGRIIQKDDGYQYIKKYCVLPEGAGINFSYKMKKDNKRCNKTHKVTFN
ncbi:MAG: hypothetical protein D3925_03620 [Candidatus Electrothrix sp. AR5]|nr:hypothetical protein [Candidatus Electrothrix sp. AR5]